jgi:hypothetical protein
MLHEHLSVTRNKHHLATRKQPTRGLHGDLCLQTNGLFRLHETAFRTDPTWCSGQNRHPYAVSKRKWSAQGRGEFDLLTRTSLTRNLNPHEGGGCRFCGLEDRLLNAANEVTGHLPSRLSPLEGSPISIFRNPSECHPGRVITRQILTSRNWNSSPTSLKQSSTRSTELLYSRFPCAENMVYSA